MIISKYIKSLQNPVFIVFSCLITLLIILFLVFRFHDHNIRKASTLQQLIGKQKVISDKISNSRLKSEQNNAFYKKNLQVFISELDELELINKTLLEKLNGSDLHEDGESKEVLEQFNILQKNYEYNINEILKNIKNNKNVSYSLISRSVAFKNESQDLQERTNIIIAKNIENNIFYLRLTFFSALILIIGLFLAGGFYIISPIVKKKNKLADDLQKSESEIKLLKNSFDVIIRLRTDGTFTYVSPSCKNILGYSPAELIGISIYDFLDTNGSNLIDDYLKSRNFNSDYSFITQILARDKNYIWVEIRIISNGFSANEITCTLRDLTDSKNLEEALNESQTKYQAVFDNMFDGFAYYKVLLNENDQTEDYILLEVNDAFERLTGLSRENVVGKKLTEIFPGIKESRYNWIGKYDKVALKGEIVSFTHYANNIERWYNITSYSPIKGYFVTLFEDITQRKTDESAIKNYISELQLSKEKIEKDAHELAQLNKKLSESEAILKELNSNKDKFFSIIAHDLRTPFNSLIGLSELLTNQVEELSVEEIKEYSASINGSSIKLFNLLENLLKWAGLQSGRIIRKPTLFNIDSLICSVSELYKNNLLDKEISLVLNLISDTKVYADKEMIETVLRNLFSNAIKFTNKLGTITVEMSNKPELTEITFSDTGIGIEQTIIDKLFKISEHITSPGTQDEKGTGLGLILCKDFVEKNGGNIKVLSTPGKGSKFIFSIPRSLH